MEAAFERAVSFLESGLRSVLEETDEPVQKATSEIRLRADRPVVLSGTFGSVLLQRDGTVSPTRLDAALFCSPEQLSDSFHRLCNYSVHTHIRSITQGFVATGGGDRVGVVGTAVCDEGGNIVSVRDITALNIRVSREVAGCATPLLRLFTGGDVQNVLIAGAPGSGKTTLLRDLARQLSAFSNGCRWKTAVLDPRQELFPRDGKAGYNCDVFRGYPNREAVRIAVRTMSPELIVCDEVATMEEARAIEQGVNTGVKFVASIHAGSVHELTARPLFRFLTQHCGFSRVVLLKGASTPGAIETILEREETAGAFACGSGGVLS